MRVLTSKDGDLLSNFDKNNETKGGFNNTSWKHIFVDNHDIETNKGKLKDNYP